MFTQYRDQIISEAEAEYPYEAVWLITKKGCKLVENISDDPENEFKVSEADSFLAYKEGLLAVVHSHCNEAIAPSKADMVGQELSGVPWGIAQVVNGDFQDLLWWGADTPRPPLIGRGFIHGVSDCYSLVRDFYFKYGIDLPIVPRSWQWWEDEKLFEELWEPFGFIEVPLHNMIPGDMLVIKVRGDHSHHCGVLIETELFAHHPGANEVFDSGRLSVMESVHRYMPYIVQVLRHKDFPQGVEVTVD